MHEYIYKNKHKYRDMGGYENSAAKVSKMHTVGVVAWDIFLIGGSAICDSLWQWGVKFGSKMWHIFEWPLGGDYGVHFYSRWSPLRCSSNLYCALDCWNCLFELVILYLVTRDTALVCLRAKLRLLLSFCVPVNFYCASTGWPSWREVNLDFWW